MRPRLLTLLLLPLLLCACPQEIEGLGDGGEPLDPNDAGLPPLPVCDKAGPQLSCAVADGTTPLRPIGSVITIQCELDGGGRAVLFQPVRLFPLNLNVQDTLNNDRKLIVQLTANKIGTDFKDTEVAADITASFADDERACTHARVTAQYAGNLWVADPGGRRVVAVASDETVLGDAVTGAGEPRLLARLTDGVLVGSTPGVGQPPELNIYGLDGQKLRGPFARHVNGTDVLAARTFHSAAQASDGFIYVSLGVGDQPGTLLRYSPDGAFVTTVTMPDSRSPRGIALLPNAGIAVGTAGDGSFARFDAGGTNGRLVQPPYRDTANDPCTLGGVFGMATLSSGDLWLSARHTTALGHHSLHATLKAFVYDRHTKHTHPDVGSMFSGDAHDWLVEAADGKLVASREGGSSVDVLDLGAFGSAKPARKLTSESWSPRAMIRLR